MFKIWDVTLVLDENPQCVRIRFDTPEGFKTVNIYRTTNFAEVELDPNDPQIPGVVGRVKSLLSTPEPSGEPQPTKVVSERKTTKKTIKEFLVIGTAIEIRYGDSGYSTTLYPPYYKTSKILEEGFDENDPLFPALEEQATECRETWERNAADQKRRESAHGYRPYHGRKTARQLIEDDPERDD